MLQQVLTKSGIAMAALTLILSGAAFALADYFATRRAVDAEAARAEASTVLLVSSFRRELEKFHLAASVLAQDPDSVAAIASHDAQKLLRLSEKFERLSVEMNAATVYLLDAQGTTLAASNWRLPTSFVGSNYAFRSYYREAMQSGKAEQFALGSVSHRPGLYIARRINMNGVAAGIMVVKVEFDALEAEWRSSGRPAFATNQQGIILVTSVPEWRFQTTVSLPPATHETIRESLDFGEVPLRMNALFAAGSVALTNTQSAYRQPYVEAVRSLLGGWSVHVLAPTREPVRAAVRNARLTVLGGLLLVAAMVAINIFRRRSAAAKADLLASERLRTLNERLAQANKLATLGQIAAGVGHEINQPLAAIATYADNSQKLMMLGKLTEANDNLVRIATLTERIGKITRELRGFARKASGVIEPVAIDGAIAGALLLLQERTTTLNATVRCHRIDAGLMVLAENVRLEQVFVNLLQNSLDAGGHGTLIDIALRHHNGMIEVSVRDNGPGLSAATRASLFQPFSTSKQEGLGLGLIISRDIMADFGGDLVATQPVTGAEFVMRLRPAS